MPEKEDKTYLEPESEEPKKKKKYKKKVDISYEEIQQKLTRLINFLATLVKSEKKYQEKDFIEEAKDLSRLSQKYEFVAIVLTVLDPLFLLAGLYSKIMDVLSSRKEKPKNENPRNKDNQRVVNIDRSGIVE